MSSAVAQGAPRRGRWSPKDSKAERRRVEERKEGRETPEGALSKPTSGFGRTKPASSREPTRGEREAREGSMIRRDRSEESRIPWNRTKRRRRGDAKRREAREQEQASTCEVRANKGGRKQVRSRVRRDVKPDTRGKGSKSKFKAQSSKARQLASRRSDGAKVAEDEVQNGPEGMVIRIRWIKQTCPGERLVGCEWCERLRTKMICPHLWPTHVISAQPVGHH